MLAGNRAARCILDEFMRCRHISGTHVHISCAAECTVGKNAQISLQHAVALVSRINKITGLFCKEPYKRDCTLQKILII